MIIKAPVAVKAALGENPKIIYHGKNQAPTTRMASAAMLREALLRAKEYLEVTTEYESDKQENDKPDLDFKSAALLPVLKKEVPLKVHVHRADDIFTAIRIAKEFDIKITLDHCTDGHLIAEELAKENYPIMIGPTLCERSKPELKNLTFKTGGILESFGIKPAIVTDHSVIPVQFLPLCAALEVKAGMSEYAALEGITINPARNCGIDDVVGSIKKGKDADIAVFDIHPFDIMSRTVHVFINGKKVK
jgi:imidazolonepropionase-like amidohydrolase